MLEQINDIDMNRLANVAYILKSHICTRTRQVRRRAGCPTHDENVVGSVHSRTTRYGKRDCWVLRF